MKYLVIVSLFLLTGCCEGPSESKPILNKDYDLKLIFENDGCKVYRFYDYGDRHYYINCNSVIPYVRKS